jgi:hypothetical protein
MDQTLKLTLKTGVRTVISNGITIVNMEEEAAALDS